MRVGAHLSRFTPTLKKSSENRYFSKIKGQTSYYTIVPLPKITRSNGLIDKNLREMLPNHCKKRKEKKKETEHQREDQLWPCCSTSLEKNAKCDWKCITMSWLEINLSIYHHINYYGVKFICQNCSFGSNLRARDLRPGPGTLVSNPKTSQAVAPESEFKLDLCN